MAKVYAKPYPLEGSATDAFDFKKHNDTFETLRAQTLALPEGKVEGALVGFSIADGKAYYYVRSEKPLVLQLVPLWDAYQLPVAHTRGLRLEDIRRAVNFDRQMEKMFTKKPSLA